MNVVIVGQGKMGSALAGALKAAGVDVSTRRARRGVLPSLLQADLTLLAVRDGDLKGWATRLAAAHAVRRGSVVLHLAGVHGVDVLGPLHAQGVHVGQAHPMVSVASAKRPPALEGATMLLQGDRAALRAGRWLARALGQRPWTGAGVDLAGYHAAGVMVAGGTVALLAAATEVALAAGVPKAVATHMFGPLWRSVAENIAVLGARRALTGPVRRGDSATILKHLAVLRSMPGAHALYRAQGALQLPLARSLREATRAQLDALERILQPPRAKRGNG